MRTVNCIFSLVEVIGPCIILTELSAIFVKIWAISIIAILTGVNLDGADVDIKSLDHCDAHSISKVQND